MDILENPLEAVAFRLYCLPDASAATGAAAWTCLAAVLAAAAAAGLWRLRSSTPPVAGTASLKPLELEPSKSKGIPLETASSSVRSPDSAASTTASSSATTPKERYTAYYRVGFCDVDEEEGDDDDEEEAEEQDEDDGVYKRSETTAGPFGWEVVRSLPLSPTAAAAEMGRYRSPTALGSGSVVRLWDEAVDAGLTASPRRRSRVVGTVSAF